MNAALTINDANYGVASYYTHSAEVDIVNYDWSGGDDLFFMTSDRASYKFGGLYRVSGGVASTAVAGNDDFSGASVVAAGDYILYNTSDFTDQKIFKYGPLNGSANVAQISNARNVGLYLHQGELFITGATGFGPNHIYHTDLKSDGGFVSDPPLDLGITSNPSGPLAFDGSGNLYYAPGYLDASVYKWSAAQVAAAIADPVGNPLSVEGQKWLDYSSIYSGMSGATSMLLDDGGNLLLTLSNFVDPSVLASFEIGMDGEYAGDFSTILSDTSRLGELRFHDGEVYFSSGNSIMELVAVPEPSAWGLLGFVIFGVVVLFRRSECKVSGRKAAHG